MKKVNITWQGVLAAMGTVLLLIAAIWSLAGCTETQKKPVWGKGELPADYQTIFGNTNPSRLNYVQQLQIDKHAKVIAELARRVIAIEAVDPNEVEVEKLRVYKDADSTYGWRIDVVNKINEIIDKINPEAKK